MRGKIDENMPTEASKPSRAAVLALVQAAIPVLASEWAERRLWIVDPGHVRIRSAGTSAV